MAVHQSTVSIAVLNADGKLVMQSVIETRKAAILEFFQGLRGTIHVTLEEGNYTAWLYPLLARVVAKVIVCNPRKNALLKSGNKGDQIDAHVDAGSDMDAIDVIDQVRSPPVVQTRP